MDAANKKTVGFTLIEILIVIAIIGILALIVLLSLRGSTQIAKAQDTRRKADIKKIGQCLEEYYNDHGYFLPSSQYSCGGTALSPCIPTIPCDPYKPNQPYAYQTDGSAKPGWYKLYTNLSYTSDPLIAQAGCSSGCVVSGGGGSGGSSSVYNYVVGSSNAPTSNPTCNGLTTPICGQPQNYVGACASCCPGSGYRVTQFGSSYYCCLDATCGP